jgi:hypothetical protein
MRSSQVGCHTPDDLLRVIRQTIFLNVGVTVDLVLGEILAASVSRACRKLITRRCLPRMRAANELIASPRLIR